MLLRFFLYFGILKSHQEVCRRMSLILFFKFYLFCSALLEPFPFKSVCVCLFCFLLLSPLFLLSISFLLHGYWTSWIFHLWPKFILLSVFVAFYSVRLYFYSTDHVLRFRLFYSTIKSTVYELWITTYQWVMK